MGVLDGFFRKKENLNENDLKNVCSKGNDSNLNPDPLDPSHNSDVLADQEWIDNSAHSSKESGFGLKSETVDTPIITNESINTDSLGETKIKDFVSRYLSKAPLDFLKAVISLSESQSGSNKEMFKVKGWYDIDRVKELYSQIGADFTLDLNCVTSDAEREEIEGCIELNELIVKFFEDSKNFKRLFDKYGYDVSFQRFYGVILECAEGYKIPLQKEIEEQISNDLRECFEPYLIIWKSKLGSNASEYQIINEVYRTLLPQLDDISNLSLGIYQWILKEFGYDCSTDKIESLLSEIVNDIEIENFENNLGNEFDSEDVPVQNPQIIDISNLSGYQFEEALCNIFEKLGYNTEITSKSHDQGADLIISQDDTKIVVQAKYYQGKVSNGAIQEIVAAKAYYGADGAMVVTTGSYTHSAIELAEVNDVVLWDGEKLSEVLSGINLSEYHCPYCGASICIHREDLVGKNITTECPTCENQILFENGVIISEDDIKELMTECVDTIVESISSTFDVSIAKLDTIVGYIVGFTEKIEGLNEKERYVLTYLVLNDLGRDYDFHTVKEVFDSIKCNNPLDYNGILGGNSRSIRTKAEDGADEVEVAFDCPACNQPINVVVGLNANSPTIKLTCPHCGARMSANVSRKNDLHNIEEE